MGLNFQFRVSLNRQWAAQKLRMPPDETRWAEYNGSFVAEEHTPTSLMEQIAKGYSFTAVLSGCQGLCCGSWCTDPEHSRYRGTADAPMATAATRTSNLPSSSPWTLIQVIRSPHSIICFNSLLSHGT